MKIVIAFDPSGNFYEGKGTTGYCIARDAYIYEVGQIYSAECKTQMEYWSNVIDIINKTRKSLRKDDTLEVVCEDYRLYASASEAQINSNLETPQLIGAIKWYCHIMGIPITMQMAAEVKRRWSDEILEMKGIINRTHKNQPYHLGDLIVLHHAMDAVRHCLHYTTFKQKTRNKDTNNYIVSSKRKKERIFYEY